MTGWRPARIAISVPSSSSGLTYDDAFATSANDTRQSRVATAEAACWISPARPAIEFLSPLKRRVSASRIRSSALRIRSSNSFSSGVMYRSAPVSVCFRMYSAGTFPRCALVISM
jgi:hypothetical protein